MLRNISCLAMFLWVQVFYIWGKLFQQFTLSRTFQANACIAVM